MPARRVRYFALGAALATSVALAHADAQTPTISGNGWVALAIIAVFVGGIWLLIMGALHVERRDATLGRGRRDRDRGHGWFGFYDDDDDAPDGNGHGNGN
jgi:hypothetical protein